MQPHEGGEHCRGMATPLKGADASEQGRGAPPPPTAPPPRGRTALLGSVGRGIEPNLHDNWPHSFFNWPHFGVSSASYTVPSLPLVLIRTALVLIRTASKLHLTWPGAQPGRPTLRHHETEEELPYYKTSRLYLEIHWTTSVSYLSYRHRQPGQVG